MKIEKMKKIQRIVNQYPVIVQEDRSGGYWVSCPILQGCYSQGETVDEALENIKEAIALCNEDRIERQPQGDVSLHLVRV
ncbi:MAG: type II toxin-antitoxin system HicB family antitoxin [Patescibacteria group bacterium]